MSSEEEPDYMSDDFLTKCVKSDLRPGLIHNRSEQRSHNIIKRKQVTDEVNKQRFRPKHEIEEEQRNKGLSEAIGNDNKGFALLQKMGYKPGSGIGKEGKGKVEPINITVKVDRQGLGRETALKEIAAHKLEIHARKMKKLQALMNTDDYRLRLTKKMEEKQAEKDLRKSQRLCQTLDLNENIDEPAEEWFWPKLEEVDEEIPAKKAKATVASDDDTASEYSGNGSDTEEEEQEPQQKYEYGTCEKLELITMYLRRTYFYCIWCCTQFNDFDDMRESCPGPTKNDH